MGRNSELQTGGLPRGVRRQWTIILALLTVVWRLVPLIRLARESVEAAGSLGEIAYVRPFVGSGFNLVEFFLNPAISWVGSPFYLLLASIETQLGTGGGWLLLLQVMASGVTVFTILHVGERMLGTLAGFLAAGLWAVATPAILSPLALLPSCFLMLFTLLFVDRLHAVGHNRQQQASLGLGFWAGCLSLVSGFAALWLPAMLLWLPTMSRRFRGVDGLRVAGAICFGFFLALSPVWLHGAIMQHDLVLPFENAAYDLDRAALNGDLVQRADGEFVPYPVGRRERSILLLRQENEGSEPKALARSAQYLGSLASRWGDDVLGQGSLLFSRAAAFFGGTISGPLLESAPTAGLFRGLPTLPTEALLILSFLGGLALLGSLRSYAPLYCAVAIPCLVGVFTGLSASVQMVSTPFLALMGGYGLARWWEARRWPFTWIVAPLLLVAALGWVRLF